jgi:hypothetical protein
MLQNFKKPFFFTKKCAYSIAAGTSNKSKPSPTLDSSMGCFKGYYAVS